MARRRKSTFKPLYLVVPLLLIIGGFVGMKFLKGKTAGFEGVASLSPREYLHNNASVQGNTYQLTALVGERLHATDAGRIYALEANENGEVIPLTALFAGKLAGENVQVGQELVLKVQIDNTGLLRVQEIKRS
jgi:hypothetical protein